MTLTDSFVPDVNKMSYVAVKWKTKLTEIEIPTMSVFGI